MLKNGNGRPEVCAGNLLQITRGEVPYERLKGLDRALINQPSATVTPQVSGDVMWLLGTYEPRLEASNIHIQAVADKYGQFGVQVDVRGGRS